MFSSGPQTICAGQSPRGDFAKGNCISDEDDIIFQFCRTFVVNGINVPASSPDLLDRSILIELERLEEKDRKDKKTILDQYNRSRPYIFGAILDTLSKAMRLYPSIDLNRLPRMADWTVWGCAIAEALEIGKERFLAAYRKSLATQNDEVVTSNPVCIALMEFMEDKATWSGKPSDLYVKLTEIAGKAGLDNSKAWPKAANTFSRRLNGLSHNLSEAGLTLARNKESDSKRQRIITIQKTDNHPAKPSESSIRPNPCNTIALHSDDARTIGDASTGTVRNTVRNNYQESLHLDDADDMDDLAGNPTDSDSPDEGPAFAMTEGF